MLYGLFRNPLCLWRTAVRIGSSLIFAMVIAIVVGLSLGTAEAAVYVRTHKDGHKEFTNRPSGPGWIFHMKESGYTPTIRLTNKKGKPKKIEEIAGEYEIDPALVKAIVKAESNSDPRAVSRKGAQGLMQLMPALSRQMKVKRPFDPRENVVGGVKYIKGLLASYGDLRLALAAYNAGPGTVKKYAGIPPYRETINYVKKVIKFYKEFKKEGRLGSKRAGLRRK